MLLTYSDDKVQMTNGSTLNNRKQPQTPKGAYREYYLERLDALTDEAKVPFRGFRGNLKF